MARARISDKDGITAVTAVLAAQREAESSRAPGGAGPEADGGEREAGWFGGEAAEPGHPLAGVDRATLATAVRYTLQLLAERAKGNTVEVRVPPFGAVQCIEGPGHTRGTPPNVVETDAQTWLALVTGSLEWMPGVESGRVHASGQRADLRGYIPLAGLPHPAP